MRRRSCTRLVWSWAMCVSQPFPVVSIYARGDEDITGDEPALSYCRGDGVGEGFVFYS